MDTDDALKQGWGRPPKSQSVGVSVPRVDAPAKVTGQALFPGDLSRPGMLHMKILFAGRPHARIRRLETTRAAAAPGVVAVLTGRDVPVNAYGLAFTDQPVFCDEVVRWEGDQVAAVVAESADAAARARELIEVDYEDLPVLTDPREAMEPGAQQVHAGRERNILDQIHIRRGEVEPALSASAQVVEGVYFCPMQEHAYLQPEAGLAYLDGDVVVVETAGQWAHHDQRQIAASLGLPPERVRVIYAFVGGAFGGREDISVQIVLALAALRTGRPVKVVWSREESIRGHAKRHQMVIRSRWGADRAGILTAAQVEVIADAGAYAYTSTMVLGHAALTCTGVYAIPNVQVDAYAVYTNNVPGGAFRGFGSPQGTFAAELQIDKLAARLGLDPVTIRERNVLRPGDPLSVGAPLPASIHLDRLLERCAEAAGWCRKEGPSGGWSRPATATTGQASLQELRRPSHAPNPLIGHGIALGMKNIGFSFGFPEESTATIELRGEAVIEEATVFFAGAECGQGVQTVILQMTAEALGLPMGLVHLVGSDTSRAPESGSASASRLTLMGGNAVIGAARAALERWDNEERPATATFTFHAPETTAFDPVTGEGKPLVVYSPVAQATRVTVDPETGQVQAPAVITVVDVGQAINPAMVEGQVQGAVAQGLGYAILENFITRDGRVLTPNLSSYLIPTILDVPERCESIVFEHPDSIGPWGARGVGETPLITVAPAVASAVHDATGIWFDSLPLTPERVLAGLMKGGASESAAEDKRRAVIGGES